MKKSSIVLISGAGFLLLATIAGIVAMRVQFDQFRTADIGDRSGPFFADANLVAQDLPGGDKRVRLEGGEQTELGYTGFDSLRFSGAWELRLTQGDSYAVAIQSPDGGDFQILTRLDGTVLDASIRGYGLAWKGARAIATVTVPKITAILSRGAVDVSAFTVDTDSLRLELSGGSNLTLKSGRIGELTAELNGAYRVDLSGALTRNAHINAKGGGHVELAMDGGSIRGQLDGAVTLIYKGAVSGVNVSAHGISSVQKQ